MLPKSLVRGVGVAFVIGVVTLAIGWPTPSMGQSSGQPDIAPLWVKKNNFGTVNAAVGDLNNDGFDDAITLGAEPGSPGQGTVGVLLGSPHGLQATRTQGLDPPRTGEQAVAGLGDVDGDGHPDIIVGAPDEQTSMSTSGAGTVYAYFGDDEGVSSSYDWKTSGPSTDPNYFGAAVAGAGDVDGDGYADVLVGDPGFQNPQLCLEKDGPGNGGGVWLFRGSDDGPATSAAWSFSWRDKPARRGACLGYTVNGVGDINDDGYDDVVVAAPLWRDGSNQVVGKVFGFYGSSDGLSEEPDWSVVHPGTTSEGTFWGDPLEGIFGWSISDGGDINGDGIDDLVVGGRGMYENETDDTGDHPLMTKYFIFEGSASGIDDSPDDVITKLGGDPLNPSSGKGQTEFSLGGDENDDGYDDLIVPASAPELNLHPYNDHWVIHYGSPSGLNHSVGVNIYSNFFPNSPTPWGYVTQAELDGNFNGSGGADPMAFATRSRPTTQSTGLHVFTADKNPAPNVNNQTVTVDRSESVDITFQASDPYDDPLSYEVTLPPQRGSLSELDNDAGTVTYQAPNDFAGTDPFEYTVTDAYDRTATATIEVTVKNGAPIFEEPPAEAGYTTRVGERLTVPIEVTDPEGDTITKRSPSSPEGASIQWDDGEFRWTPDADQTGGHTLVLEADDGFDTTTREVTLTVEPASDDDDPCPGRDAATQDACSRGADAGRMDAGNSTDASNTDTAGCGCRQTSTGSGFPIAFVLGTLLAATRLRRRRNTK